MCADCPDRDRPQTLLVQPWSSPPLVNLTSVNHHHHHHHLYISPSPSQSDGLLLSEGNPTTNHLSWRMLCPLRLVSDSDFRGFNSNRSLTSSWFIIRSEIDIVRHRIVLCLVRDWHLKTSLEVMSGLRLTLWDLILSYVRSEIDIVRPILEFDKKCNNRTDMAILWSSHEEDVVFSLCVYSIVTELTNLNWVSCFPFTQDTRWQVSQ